MLLKLWFDGTVYLGELACRLAGNYACVILVGVLESPPPYILSDFRPVASWGWGKARVCKHVRRLEARARDPHLDLRTGGSVWWRRFRPSVCATVGAISTARSGWNAQ